ncbi:MAG: GAF domain-containing protein [Kouleothrix sp.]
MSDYEYLLGAPALTNAIPRTDTLMRTSDSTLDRLVHLAAATLHVPVALLSLSFPDHELVLSGLACPTHGSARQARRWRGRWAGRACAANEPVIADDVHTHPLLSTHPALRDLGLRTYASIPLRDASGQPIGCLSIGDYLPRAWRPDEIARLHDMGALAADTLELRRWRDHASQLERALRESEERAQVVAETIDDVIVTIDTTGRIIFINSAVERLFGYAPKHVLGQSDRDADACRAARRPQTRPAPLYRQPAPVDGLAHHRPGRAALRRPRSDPRDIVPREYRRRHAVLHRRAARYYRAQTLGGRT